MGTANIADGAAVEAGVASVSTLFGVGREA
jgi:hypothetical protein